MRIYQTDEVARIQVAPSDVRDGDSFGAKDLADHSLVEVRLFGIDAPEGLQTYGSEAREHLKSLLSEGDDGSSHLYMQCIALDPGSEVESGDRVVGLVYREFPDDSINARMVRSGWAYWYRQLDAQNRYGFRELEEEARREEIGVWKGDRLEIRPWDYRRFHRRFTEDSDALIETIEGRVRSAVQTIEGSARDTIERIGNHSGTMADTLMGDAQTVIAELGRETAWRENRRRIRAEEETLHTQRELDLAVQARNEAEQRIHELEDEVARTTAENVTLQEQYREASEQRDQTHEELGYARRELDETKVQLQQSAEMQEDLARMRGSESRSRGIWKVLSLVAVWLTTGATLFALLHFYAIERAFQSRAPIEWLLFFVAIPTAATGAVWYGCRFVNERRD